MLLELSHVNRRFRAFSLIEVVVAMFILAAAGGVILLGLMLSLSQGKESQERVLAQLLAGSILDELKAHPYGSTRLLAGWEADGSSFVRQQTVASVINGLESPIAYQMKVTPQASGIQAHDSVQVSVEWREKSGPAKLEFTVPMSKGWNQAPDRGAQPTRVAANWHDPKAYSIPSEPSYRSGSSDHTVNPDPDAGDIINKDTKKYQALYAQLTRAKIQLDTDQSAVSDDQSKIDGLQSQIADEKSQKNPDQSKIASLQSQLTAAQAQLSTDQGKVVKDQQDVDHIQQEIDALSKS